MDIDNDDSALSENSEFEEGSSYSMSVFLSSPHTQLDSTQAKAAHLRERKEVKMRTWNCQGPNVG
jgi:hypothetical protein